MAIQLTGVGVEQRLPANVLARERVGVGVGGRSGVSLV